jgi:hypothetical protein
MFCDCVREQLDRPVDLDELLGRQVLDPLATVCAAAEGLDVVGRRGAAGGQPGRAGRH